MIARPLAVLLASAVLLSACASDEAPEVAHLDDVTVIENTGPGSWADAEEPLMSFDLQQTFGSDDGSEAMLATVQDVTTDANGNVYVLDVRSHRLLSFAPDGTLRWAVRREGEAPGEFAGTFWRSPLAYDGATGVWVINQNGSRLDHFHTADGALVEAHNLAPLDIRFASLAGITSAGHFIVATGMPGHVGEQIHRLNLEEGRVIDAREVYLRAEPLDSDTRAELPEFSVQNDRLLGRYALNHYELWEATLTGDPVRVITREGKKMLRSGQYAMDGGGIRFQVYSTLAGPFLLPDDHLLTYTFYATGVQDPDAHLRRMIEQDGPPPTFNTTIDLFAPDGSFLGSRVWEGQQEPPIGTPVHVSAEGQLYTRTNEPFPQVRRFALTINAPAP
ncbi:MAG: hypothetical protein GVY15_06040 [Bacteroidetes bacterium]|jgi:hypothetical protein|nr:hypothetical protein [Bacteroidota bacterium]